jgi:hypothetical protein
MMSDKIFDDACRESEARNMRELSARELRAERDRRTIARLAEERDRYRHALANIIARFGAKRLPKNEDESRRLLRGRADGHDRRGSPGWRE